MAKDPELPYGGRPRVGDRYILARVVVTLVGVAGFLGLLIAAVHIRSAQELLRISAFVWFLGFGAVRVILDLRAARSSRRRNAFSRYRA